MSGIQTSGLGTAESRLRLVVRWELALKGINLAHFLVADFEIPNLCVLDDAVLTA